MGNKVIKSVSFNQTVADDKAMLKYLSRRNFSGFVKKLILKEMKGGGVVVDEEVAAEPATVIPSARDQINQMRQQRQQPASPMLNIQKPKQ